MENNSSLYTEAMQRIETVGKKNLKTLDLRNLNLEELPSSVIKLKELKKIYLQGNKLKFLPKDFEQLSELNLLSLGSNKFASFPLEILYLHKLVKLFFWNNALASIPSELFRRNPNLKTLRFQKNKINELPTSMFSESKLSDIDISNNLLISLPDELGQLRNLWALDASENLLGEIPRTIGQLKKLKFLFLGGNQISVLPPEISNLKNLQRLWLVGNPLSLNPKVLELEYQPQYIIDSYFGIHHNKTVDEGMKETNRNIFISYARDDLEKVKKIYSQLQASKHTPWLDVFDIKGGEIWLRAIYKAIESSNIFIAILSNSSISRRGVIQKELKKALDKWEGMLPDDIYIIPLRIDDCPIPELLKDFQIIEWDNGKGMDRLLEAIQVGLERRKA